MATEADDLPSIPNSDNWDNSTEWLKQAVAAQNEYYARNGGVMYNEMSNYNQIETEILIKAFLETPKSETNPGNSLNQWFSRPERKIAIKLRKIIQNIAKTEAVQMNSVYVMSYLKDDKIETKVPVFYFKSTNDTTMYIDLYANVYEGWEHFLKKNQIDPSLICYPVEGHYGQTQSSAFPTFDESVKLGLKVMESASCGWTGKIKAAAKKLLSYAPYIVIGAAAIGRAAGSSTAAWGLKLQNAGFQVSKYMLYASAAASTTLGLLNICDKVGTYESIIGDVLMTISGVLTLATPALQSINFAKMGLSPGNLVMVTTLINWLPTIRTFATCIGVASCLCAMVYKWKNGIEIGAADYFFLAASLYQCYGSVTSPTTAKAVYQEVQQDYIQKCAKFGIGNIFGSGYTLDALKETGTRAAVVGGAIAGVYAHRATGGSRGSGSATTQQQKSSSTNQGHGGSTGTQKKQSSGGGTSASTGAGGGGQGPNKPNLPNQNHCALAGSLSNITVTPTTTTTTTNAPAPATVTVRPSFPNPRTNRSDPTEHAAIGLLPSTPPQPTPAETRAIQQEHVQLVEDLETQFRTQNDTTAEQGLQYYRDNIVRRLAGENQYVVNNQLIRMIRAARDPADLFVELALTNTTIELHRGVLLINGQLNVDGAAFAAATNDPANTNIRRQLSAQIQANLFSPTANAPTNPPVSFRTSILNAVSDVNVTQSVDTALNPTTRLQLRTTHLRWTLETDVTAFTTFLQQNNITLNNITSTATITNFNRLIQAHNAGRNDVPLWQVVDLLAQILDCDSVYEIAGILEIIRYHPLPSSSGNRNRYLKVLLKGLQSVLNQRRGNAFTNDTDYQAALQLVNETDAQIHYYENELQQRGIRDGLRFSEMVAIVGPRAAAFELYGHILKRYHQQYANDPNPRETILQFAMRYMIYRQPGTMYTQDGQRWR
uniref:DUF4781 domain-containing protein n=1 Tax=Panagrellus redivivus TaxID=6233 RepID=A0A7E4VZQ1_PANRE